ncbi:MAG: hypothetical protein FJX68_19460 [Alphaproteobacteria bacterium]|nr:hypothetical protein [Alphaproteobacteria bacterium]
MRWPRAISNPASRLLVEGHISIGMFHAQSWLTDMWHCAQREPVMATDYRAPKARTRPGNALPLAANIVDARRQLEAAARAVGTRLWPVLTKVLLEGRTLEAVGAELAVAVNNGKGDRREHIRLAGHALRLGLFQLLDHLGSRQTNVLPPAPDGISASLRQTRQSVATVKRAAGVGRPRDLHRQ